MLAMLEGRLEEKSLCSAESCLLAATTRLTIRRHSIRNMKSETQIEYSKKHPHPARQHEPQNFRLSHADGSASVLLAATLALAVSGVPAGCGFQSSRLIETAR